MKKILLFVLPILIIVAGVFTIFGVLQARFTKERFMDDLEGKARVVAESMELSIRYALTSHDLRTLNRIAQQFQKRKKPQGCIIYDKNGKILAITTKFSHLQQEERPYIKASLTTQTPQGFVEKFQEHSFYSYLLPIINEQNNTLGLVQVIYDTSYMFNILTALWQRISITLIILLTMIALVAALIQKKIFITPIKQLTEWFRHFQKGETDQMHPIQEGELGQLASEVEQVALSLRIARKVIANKAQSTLADGETWNEEKLRNLIHAKLGDNSFIVVSNREPFMHVTNSTTGAVEAMRPAGGVVAAIDPILQASGGTWVAHGAGNADTQFVNSKDKLGVPPEDNRYILKRVWLTKEEEAGYYYGFANEGLWPLCHITHTRPIFREEDWHHYQQVNQKFATAVLEEIPLNSPFIFIQDYHFTLLPRMLKEQRPDATVALFWHIPWPNPEVFSICPYQQEILEGILACDLIGFHLQCHCNNFIDTVNRLTESRIDMEKFSVVRANREAFIRAFPISINPTLPKVTGTTITKLRNELKLTGQIVGLGVDRLDYTKGIVERIRAIDKFLTKYPQYKKKFTFIQIAAPSRTNIDRYHNLMEEVNELVTQINRAHATTEWQPIIYLFKHFSPAEIVPYYKLADLCIVSSLHDGMNLVAKEYISATTDLNGVLILSCFTGASRELSDALLINPYSTEEFANTIKTAIEMAKEEKQKRMENMQHIINDNNVYKWAGSIITELTALKKE